MKVSPPQSKLDEPSSAKTQLDNPELQEAKESTAVDSTPPQLEEPQQPQYTIEEALERVRIIDDSDPKVVPTEPQQPDTDANGRIEEMYYCPECYLPIHPDPKPEKLYIFLHALVYTTSLGRFETEMPEWAAPGWEWDRS